MGRAHEGGRVIGFNKPKVEELPAREAPPPEGDPKYQKRFEKRRREATGESDILVYVTQRPGLFTMIEAIAAHAMDTGKWKSRNEMLVELLHEWAQAEIKQIPESYVEPYHKAFGSDGEK